MDELDKLEELSLISKVCTELENHLGLNDKDLGMFHNVVEIVLDNGEGESTPLFNTFAIRLFATGCHQCTQKLNFLL
jgi:hypothetical protein